MPASSDDKTTLLRQALAGEQVGRFTIVKPLYRPNTYQARDGKHHVRIEIVPDGVDLARLRAAVAAASSFAHPNICQIRELVETDNASGGHAVLVMDLVDGVSLRDRLLLGALDPKHAVEWLEQLLSALARGHAAGVAHGDVSALNVVIDASGTLKLLDFGMVRDVRPTIRADLRAVGTLAYAMLTGDTGPVNLAAVPDEHRVWIRRCTTSFVSFPDASGALAALRGMPQRRSRAWFAVGAAAVAVGAVFVWLARRDGVPEEPVVTGVSSAVRARLDEPYRGRPPLPTGATDPDDVRVSALATPPRVTTTPVTTAPSKPSDPPRAIAPTESIDSIAQVRFPAEAGWLDDAAVLVLEQAYAHLAKHRTLRVEVGGHSSSDGKDDDKQRIALWRANTVRDFLVKRGIDAHRIEVRSYGDAKPAAPNDTADGRARNRRVEIRVTTSR